MPATDYDSVKTFLATAFCLSAAATIAKLAGDPAGPGHPPGKPIGLPKIAE